MSRSLAAVAYLTATATATYGLAALAVLPLHGEAQGIAFVEAAVAGASIAGALTPRNACLFTGTTPKDRP